MDEFFKEVCQWNNGECRNSRIKGSKYACCSKAACPGICPLKMVFPNRCKNPPPICRYYLCNIAKIYIMENSHLHGKYIELLKEQDKIGIEFNNCV